MHPILERCLGQAVTAGFPTGNPFSFSASKAPLGSPFIPESPSKASKGTLSPASQRVEGAHLPCVEEGSASSAHSLREVLHRLRKPMGTHRMGSEGYPSIAILMEITENSVMGTMI